MRLTLQRWFKGSELEAVRSKLLLPTMVPEVIIYSMVEKAYKLENLIANALPVQYLCAMMEACGRPIAHLCKPSLLLVQLTNKLPPHN